MPGKFEKFYYSKVAMGEGCGFAERIIDIHEFDWLSAGSHKLKPQLRLPSRGSFKRFLQIAGLMRRPTGR